MLARANSQFFLTLLPLTSSALIAGIYILTAPHLSLKPQHRVALMGLIVGVVVAGQVLYTSTLEHLKEYGTLKAMGATRWYVARVVLIQAVLCSVLGCLLGLVATFPLINLARQAIPWIFTPWWTS